MPRPKSCARAGRIPIFPNLDTSDTITVAFDIFDLVVYASILQANRKAYTRNSFYNEIEDEVCRRQDYTVKSRMNIITRSDQWSNRSMPWERDEIEHCISTTIVADQRED